MMHLKMYCTNLIHYYAEDRALKYNNLNEFLNYVQARDPHQPEFLQAVEEVMTSLWPFIEKIQNMQSRDCWNVWLNLSV